MRILIVTQTFLPEMGALANRMYPIASALAVKGHEVFIATGMPNYPRGIVFDEYRKKRTFTETLSGCTVIRTAYHTAPRNQSALRQLYSYATFVLASFLSGWRAGKIDVIFVTSPPIFPAIAAIWLARLRRAKVVFDVRDLWPDEIVACGAAREGSLPVRAMQGLERWVYRHSDGVCCTTSAFVETVAQRGVPRSRISLVPNGADLSLFRPLPPDNHLTREYPLQGRFVVMYSGLIGIKHGLATLIEAAQLLKDTPDIVFMLVGSGQRLKALQNQAAALGLSNVIFAGEKSVADIPFLLARADVCFSGLLPEPYLKKIITVKLFEYMACGKPMVAALAGEGADLVSRAGCGIVVPPGNAEAVAAAIRTLYNDQSFRSSLGEAGAEYVARYHSREVIAAQLEQTLLSISEQIAHSGLLIPESAENFRVEPTK